LIANNNKSRNNNVFHQQQPQSLVPLWKKNIWMDLYIFINPQIDFNDYNAMPQWKISIQNNHHHHIQLNKYMDLFIAVRIFFFLFFIFFFLLIFRFYFKLTCLTTEKCLEIIIVCSYLSCKRFISN
jgi:hypothetical protein